jgi:hypothetical protein
VTYGNRRVCGVRHVPVFVEVRRVGGLTLEGVSVAIAIDVAAAAAAAAAPTARDPVTATAAGAVVVVGRINVWLDDHKGVIGEVGSGENVVHHVDSVFRAVE